MNGAKRRRHFRLWDASIDLGSYVPFQDPVTGRWWHWVPSTYQGVTFKTFVEGRGSTKTRLLRATTSLSSAPVHLTNAATSKPV